jgi:hypothetical protein
VMISGDQKVAGDLTDGDHLDVNRLAVYLQAHNRIRVATLSFGLIVASAALYIGAAVFALTLGPKAVGDYMGDRLLAGCLIALAVLLNIGIASVLTKRGRSFLARLILSLLATVGGSILMFGLIVARVMLTRR